MNDEVVVGGLRVLFPIMFLQYGVRFFRYIRSKWSGAH